MGGFAYELERQEFVKTDIPEFRVGDTVDVHVKIQEGNKERIQLFSGVVIARKHQGLRETFTVRRLVAGEGVERVFPIHSPKIEKIDVRRLGKVRRAKLYYLRDRVGKETRIKEDLKRNRNVAIDTRRSVEKKVEAPAAAAESTEAAAESTEA